MSSVTIEARAAAATSARAADLPHGSARPAVLAALAAIAAIAIQGLWIPIDADVSWLITVSERLLAGERLYADVFELNPPASVWLYVPLVWLAQLIGARPEAVVVAGFIAGGLASVGASVRLAARLDDPPRPELLAGAVAFISLVLPMALFAQREHAALLLAVPALIALALIAQGKVLGKAALYGSGFAAGLVIVIKPYFLFAILAPALWAAIKRKSLAPLLGGMVGAAAAIGIYAIALLAFASAYFDWLPVIASTYAPMHAPWWKVALGPTLYPAICLGLVILLRAPRVAAVAMTWALGAIGFLIAAYAQAKNYPNHWLPGAGLALLAAFALVAQRGIERNRRLAIGAGLAIVAVAQMYHWAIRPDSAVAAAVRQIAPGAPKITALSPQLVTGHPVTRNVGGRWVGSRAGLFTAAGARFVGLGDPFARQAYREDLDSFARDVERNAPDVVLVHRASKSWLLREPVIATAMRDYTFGQQAGDTEVWVRRDARR